MITLRQYQEEAIESVFREWKTHQATLLVAATGLGKTTIFAEIIRRVMPHRCLILVHRYELMDQAVKRLKYQCGISCDIEMSGYKARTGFFGPECVVATVQTLTSGLEGEERMTKFSPNDYQYVIIDEAHRATAQTYQRILNYFKQNPNLKILGVTATPDRSDEEALKQIFDSVAFDYDILHGIQDGWLVPVEQQMVYVESIDFTNVKTTAGDLNGKELAQIMEQEETLQGVAHSALEIIGSRRSLAFASSVNHAQMLADIFNRHKFGMADFIHGGTDRIIRKEKLDRFKSGETQIMVNCGIFTEGADFPFLEVVIQARPTKSRCLYAQIIGRALRPLPGTVDGIDSSEARRMAIAASQKPHALIIDYVGNGTRHKLMTSADILGGKVSPDILDRAKKKACEHGAYGESVDMVEMIQESEQEVRAEREKALAEAEAKRLAEIARKAAILAKATYTTQTISAFNKYQIEPKKVNSWDERHPLSSKQIDILKKRGVDINGMSMTHQKQLFHVIINKLSDGQIKVMKRAGYDISKFDVQEAKKIIGLLFDNNFSKAKVDAILYPVPTI